MQFTTLISAVSLAAVSLIPAVSAEMKFVSEFGGPAGQGLRFQTTLKDRKVWHLSVYDTLVLTPNTPAESAWYFRKTDKTATLDTLYYKPDNKLATYVPAKQEFQMRKTDQLAKGYWNLTSPPQHLKFSDKIEFRACSVTGAERKKYGYLKKVTTRDATLPSWAKAGSCEDIVLECVGC